MKRILTYFSTLFLLAVAFLAGGVAGVAHAQDNSLPAGMVGPAWRLVEIQRSPQDALDTSNLNVTLTFEADGRAGGNSTCNGYSAAYRTGAGQALTFTDLVSTLRACVDTSLMDIESEYYAALSGVSSYTFDGATLQLLYNNGASMLKYDLIASSVPGMPATGVAEGFGASYAYFMGPVFALIIVGATFVVLSRFSRQRI